MNDYKSTLYLPETDFPMRGDLANKEPQRLQRWYNDQLYCLIRKAKKGKEIFFLHDGPPYANGALHIGHAVNKIIKDIIIKSKTLEGFDCPYIPGWDCHGLPIELNVEKSIGKPGNNVSIAEFRKVCRNYAAKQISNQKQDFIRMGVIADWENPYLTMDFKNEAEIIRILGKIIANGYLVKGTKPVPWCMDCGSALSDAEVIHNNVISQAIDVAFYCVDIENILTKFGIPNLNLNNNKIALIVWTTTPWTLPANQAISVDAQASYQLIKITNTEERLIIIAKSLSNKVMDRFKITHWDVLGETLGSELEFIRLYHPFFNLTVPVLLSNHVTLDMGTGIVHMAPSHGIDDYMVCKKYNISPINLIKANGCYRTNTHPKLDGVSIFKANEIIINILKNKGIFLHIQNIQHSYPHCWRHKSPIIFRATEQWFINMEHKRLREKSLDNLNKIQWIPSWGKARLKAMIANRPDWCISRQRTWGVPIPLFIHKENGNLHPNTLAIIEKVAVLVEQRGIQAWWDLLPTDILPKYEVEKYKKNLDTLDVWFDSGSTHILINQRPELNFKISDLYLEGSDQYRGWFMSSLMIAMTINNDIPCKQIITHGFTVDSNRKKMSKSVGNIISPQIMIKKWGADIMRLWVASTDYSKDITVSEEIINRSTDNYRRIRNTVRFLLANLKDFQPKNEIIPYQDMIRLDRWILQIAKSTQQHIINAYKQYEFHSVVHNMMQFCSIELGSFYLDIVKDRLYTTKKNSLARRSCQTAIFYIAEAMVRWLAPILSFTADEIWNYLPGNRSKYVFTEEWFDLVMDLDKNSLINKDFWDELVTVRYDINKALEKTRREKKIRESLSVGIVIYTTGSIAEKLKTLGSELKFFLLTSSAEVRDYKLAPISSIHSQSISQFKLVLYKASGTKCLRCWNYTTDIGQNKQFPELCGRCVTNIIGKGEIRHFV
ncbi:MAG: isoleucine--tRNA ligase [Candidatus Dasytiphilus stammeri]